MPNKTFILGLVIFLSGCATTEPVINTVIQKVEIPIMVPCKVDTPSKPNLHFDDLTVDQDIFEKVRALLADRRQQLAYEVELAAALEACK